MSNRMVKMAIYGAVLAVTVDYFFAPTLRNAIGLKK